MSTLGEQEWRDTTKGRTLLDVRTPAEYAAGHIPGALSFPLFSNEERITIGTLYKQVNPEAAFLKGLDIVGPKMSKFVKQVQKFGESKKLCLHCWRGGKRSGSMGWLLRSAGYNVSVIPGGYKAYRRMCRETIASKPYVLRVLGGRTGCGKTAILNAIAAQEQVIDLEGLAHHKGSAFGALGEPPQPTVEQFENNLYHKLNQQDISRPIWLENESRSIGRVFIPQEFWSSMKAAPLINVERSFEERVEILVEVYAGHDAGELLQSFQNIRKRLGGQHVKAAAEALAGNDFSTAAAIALRYYDKAYQYMLDNNPSPEILMLDISGLSAAEAAQKVLACQ